MTSQDEQKKNDGSITVTVEKKSPWVFFGVVALLIMIIAVYWISVGGF